MVGTEKDGSGEQKPVKRLQLVFTQPSAFAPPLLVAENYKIGGRSLHVKMYDMGESIFLEAYDFLSASDFQMEIMQEQWTDLGYGSLGGLSDAEKATLCETICNTKLEL